MSKYEVKSVVCDYGVFEDNELKLICNSHANALKIKEILETDSDMSKPYVWQDQKIAELEKENKDLEDDHNKLIDQYNKQYNELCEEIKVHSSARERLVEKVRELEKQLENAIVPKFKVGQEIWEITPLMSWKIKRIEWHKFNGGNGDVVVEIYRLGHDGTDDYNCCIMPVDNDRFFATKEEAQAKLKELQGE